MLPSLKRSCSAMVSLFACVVSCIACQAAETPACSLNDPELKLVTVDSSPDESFLSIRADSNGRLFVGGREALFVYEPDPDGLYGQRQLLYRFPAHSWVYDIEIRGTDLYVLTLNALYIIPNGVVDRTDLKPQRLLWGVPQGHVHQCFHGLAWGPEGDLYISMGDPLWYYGDFNRPDHWGHWTFFCGENRSGVPYTGAGGVFRIRPDGTQFQVLARGLRNNCGLVFDRNWNLFNNDNDHESMPDEYVPGRLIHVTPHSDFSWPRGWMNAGTPGRADMLETMFDGMGRSVPVGQTYYDEPYLPEKYRHCLYIARWGIRAVTRYPLQERGASFKADEQLLLEGRDRARPVGVGVGRSGRLFVAVSYMAHNEGSPIYPSDLLMITRANDSENSPFEGYEAHTASPDVLWSELSQPSWQRRLHAHIEILRRGGPLLNQASRRLKVSGPDDPAMVHLIWLTAAATRDEQASPQSRERIQNLLKSLAVHESIPVRRQAVRALAEFFAKDATARPVFLKALADPDPQVRHSATLAFFEEPGDLPPEIGNGPACSDDSYLRQVATLLLAERGTLSEIERLAKSEDPKRRLAGMLAAGFKLTLPSATAPMPESLPLEPWNSEEPYHVVYADETIDLRDYGRLGLFTVAEHWKAGQHTAEQEQLFALLKTSLSDSDEGVHLQAAHFLSLLNDPRSEPLIEHVRRQSERRRLLAQPMTGIKGIWMLGPFSDGNAGLAMSHPPENGPVDLNARYEEKNKSLEWQQLPITPGGRLFDFAGVVESADAASFYAYFQLQTARPQQVMLLVGSDDGVKVWHNGQPVWTNDTQRAALPFQDVVYLDVVPGSNDVLVRVHNVQGDCALYLHYRSLDQIVVSLPMRVESTDLSDRLKSAAANQSQTKVPTEFFEVDWKNSGLSGDAIKGQQLFSAEGLGCAKCHASDGSLPVSGGPSLAGASKRFTIENVVEAILFPDQSVSPVFRTTLVATTDGKMVSGLVTAETADEIELLLPDATKRVIAKADIETRKQQDLSPMPKGLLKSPDELRDLLTYLLRSNDAK